MNRNWIVESVRRLASIDFCIEVMYVTGRIYDWRNDHNCHQLDKFAIPKNQPVYILLIGPRDVRGWGKTKKEPTSFKMVVSFFCLILGRFLCPGEAHRAHLT